MTVSIQLTLMGTDTGPFDLYSNADGYTVPFETNIPKTFFNSLYTSHLAPENTTIVRVKSVGNCTNYTDIPVSGTLCYQTLPNTYATDYIFKSGYTFIYGQFTSYKNGIETVATQKIIKLNPNKTLDKTFNLGVGFNSSLFGGCSIYEDSTGKIIATGQFTTFQGGTANRIIRLNPDGSKDTSFVYGTGFNNFTLGIGIDSTNKILICGIYSSYNGFSRNRLVRLLNDGSVDTTFNIGSGFNNTTISVLINPDDSMFVSGYFTTYNGVSVSPGITKLLSDGTRDTSFVGGTGFSPSTPNNAIYLNRIPGETSFYAVGYFTSYNSVSKNRIVKITNTGAIDSSFNPGTGFNNYADIIKIIFGDKLYITGGFTSYNGTPSYYKIILNSDGTIFKNFNTNYYSQILVLGETTLAGNYLGGCYEDLFYYTTTTTTTTIL